LAEQPRRAFPPAFSTQGTGNVALQANAQPAKLAALHGSTPNHFNQPCALISGIIVKERRTVAFIE
jgi:hypothetical protein